MKEDKTYDRTVTLSGHWRLNEQELAEAIDNALHEAGLCACDPHTENFYVMTIAPIPAEQPDNR